MSSLPINNIVHKFNNRDLSILYYPSKDLILNDLITDLECNFFIQSPYRDIKPNIIVTSLLHIYEYDFILTHNVDQNIMQTAHSLHIPVIYWPKFIVDITKINDKTKNISYIVETMSGTPQRNDIKNICLINSIVPPCPEIGNQNKVPVFIRHENINCGDIIRALANKYPDLLVVDDNKLKHKSMIELISKSSMMIDFQPHSSIKIDYCFRHGIPYITLNSDTNMGYKAKYSNVVLVNLDSSIIEAISTYQNSSLPHSPNNSYNNDMELLYRYFTQTKLTGFIL
jgi:hypothetical protein